MKERMQESYAEGVANHSDRESCVGHRKVSVEALTAARIGPVSELRNILQDADPVSVAGRQHDRARHRERPIGPAESWTRGMCGTFMHENRETRGVFVGVIRRTGRPKAQAEGRHARAPGVG